MNYSELSNTLISSLRLRQTPISISFTDAIPSGISRFAGRVAAGCRFWEDAATAAFATSAADHELCAIGVYTHNLEPSATQQTDLMDALGVFKRLGYVTECGHFIPLNSQLLSPPKSLNSLTVK